MKVGDFVKRYRPRWGFVLGRVTAVDCDGMIPDYCEVRWGNRKESDGELLEYFTPVTMTNEEKMLWILENE